MDGGIRPLQPNMRVAGPAFTVRCFPGATWALEQALELATPGDVLIVDGGGYPDVILMGGLMSMRAQSRGLGGAILDAAVRDVDQIVSLGFPVFARHICPLPARLRRSASGKQRSVVVESRFGRKTGSSLTKAASPSCQPRCSTMC